MLIAVLNKKVEQGRLMNALGQRLTAGLVGDKGKPRTCFFYYEDKDGGVHPSMSHFPFIVLKADNSNESFPCSHEVSGAGGLQ